MNVTAEKCHFRDTLFEFGHRHRGGVRAPLRISFTWEGHCSPVDSLRAPRAFLYRLRRPESVSCTYLPPREFRILS